MDTTDQPNSICHVQSIHMYTLQPSETQKQPPFGLLTGEMVVHFGVSVDGSIIITNYRLYLQNGINQHHIPLGLVETVEIRELFYLQIFCKDARTYRCTFENNESALSWYDKLSKAAEPPRQIEQLFAFYHCVWYKEKGGDEVAHRVENQKAYTFDKRMFKSEIERMQFQGDSWRITKVNENFKLCPTYPPYLLVPSCINDEMLEAVAKFRSSRRIPAAVWRHTKNGAVIARCSQPEVGWFGWRSDEDEDLIKAISDACNFDRNLKVNGDKDSVLSHSPGSLHSDESLQITGDVVGHQEKKVLIMDARSYTTAVANRARGGGCECPEYYPNCEVQFMNLANIHSIRKSFHALRQLCMSSADQPNWFSLLEGTRWLLHMSGLIKAAVTLASAVERDGRPVVVHCSDGWDRTPQIVALAELLLDPYYRTVNGFRVLIEREWLAFGHKFADRCGHSGGSDDQNERCPVFLQWLDCVQQLLNQFPVSFEFSQSYLVKLAQHAYSNLFGTFLCNSQKQRAKVVLGRTFSVWEFLEASSFKNHLYAPPNSTGRVLWPRTNVRDLRLWSEIYLGSMETNFNPEEGSGGACPGPPDLNGHSNMAKTRSYGDLMHVETYPTVYGGRRSSDPSVNRETKMLPQPITIAPTSTHNIPNPGQVGTDSGPDFLPSDLDDNPVECGQDYAYGNNSHHPTSNLTDDQIDGLDFAFKSAATHQRATVSNMPAKMSEITENISALTERLADLPDRDRYTNGTDSTIFFRGADTDGDDDADDDDSDAATARSDARPDDLEDDAFFENNNNSSSSSSGSEANGAECRNGAQVGRMLDLERSVETSTETLVSEHMGCGSSPKEYNGFEKIKSPVENGEDLGSCKVCAQSMKVTNGDVKHQNETLNCPNGTSDSPHEWDGAVLHNYPQSRHHNQPYHCVLGEDGLMPLVSPVQERLDQIIEEQRRKVEMLEKELQTSRQSLIKQVCRRCQASNDPEKQDDSSSVVESVCSASEGQASAGESLRSWEAVEDGMMSECQATTLWVPDHAVNQCKGCGIEFWLAMRRHHCRKCGWIFCAKCSENSTPLPSEQLYNPVRVCTRCYAELRSTVTAATATTAIERHHQQQLTQSAAMDIPGQCKRGAGAASVATPGARIAASSN